MTPSEEIPSMVKLDARQLGEVTLLIFGTEGVVGSGCPEDDSHANCASDEVVALPGDGAQGCGVELRTDIQGGEGEGDVGFQVLGGRGKYISSSP